MKFKKLDTRCFGLHKDRVRRSVDRLPTDGNDKKSINYENYSNKRLRNPTFQKAYLKYEPDYQPSETKSPDRVIETALKDSPNGLVSKYDMSNNPDLVDKIAISQPYNEVTLNHYTSARNVKNILNNKLKPRTNATGISFFDDNSDHIKRDMYDLKKLDNQTINKRVANGFNQYLTDPKSINELDDKKKSIANEYLKPENKYLLQYGSIDGLVPNWWKDPLGNGTVPVYPTGSLPVRLVTNIKTEVTPTKKLVPEYSPGYNILGTNGGTYYPTQPIFDFGESVVLGHKINPKNIKLQLPYGSVSKTNAGKYEDNLKDIDPSKFDVNDTYTRRIYNLWAKKNNKPLLPGSEKYR